MTFKTEILPLSVKANNYLTSVRKIPLSSLTQYKVGVNKRGEITIPFFNEDDELRLIKFRSSDGSLLKRQRKEDDGSWSDYEVKSDCEKGGKPVLLGSNLCDPDNGPLYICYGDYDAMSIRLLQVNGNCPLNAVSLPFGDRSISWIELQWDFLSTFNAIVFCIDFDDNPKTSAILLTKMNEMAVRLGKHRCWMTEKRQMQDCKDLNEVLQKYGSEKLVQVLTNIVPVPEENLIRLVDYIQTPIKEGTPIGFKDIDIATGGHAEGQTTLISGDNNAGKTTLMLNMLANFIQEGERCFYWSGEQRPDKMRWWFEQIVAGPNHLDSRVSSKTGREYFYAHPSVLQKIRNWYANYLITYDKRGLDAEDFFTILELAVRRYGITKIFIDNLMAFTGSSEQYYSAQGQFSESVHNFAEDWKCHITVIGHNKKNDHFIPDKDDVEGSKKVTNWADIVIQQKRLFSDKDKEKYSGADAISSLCKNRETEILIDVRTIFDSQSKRIVQLSESDLIYKKYGWEDEEVQQQEKEVSIEVDDSLLNF